MRILTHIVTAQEDGATVKHLLRQHFALSSSLLKSIKWREGGITLNGVPVTVTALCHAGDRLAADVSDSPSQNPNLHPIDFPLSILWEDEDLLILNKPAGITVHCAALTQEPVTVAGAVAHYLNSDQYHGVNRLDRGTTGVMVVAKSGYIHARCMALLHSGDFYREYRGICLGTPEPISGHIDLPIDRDRDSLLKRHIDPQGAPAHTDYEVLAQRLDNTPKPQEDFDIQYVTHNYYGPTYRRSTYQEISPDVIALYRYQKNNRTYTVTHNEGYSYSYDSLYPQQMMQLGEPTQVLLGGNTGDITIRSNLRNKNTLLIVGDDSILPVLPFLAAHYSEIRFLDPAQMTQQQLEQFDCTGYQRILISYSVDSFIHGSSAQKLRFLQTAQSSELVEVSPAQQEER